MKREVVQSRKQEPPDNFPVSPWDVLFYFLVLHSMTLSLFLATNSLFPKIDRTDLFQQTHDTRDIGLIYELCLHINNIFIVKWAKVQTGIFLKKYLNNQ